MGNKLQRGENGVDGSSGETAGFGPYINEGLDRAPLTNERVLQAMSRVPRHKFVDERYQKQAYADQALPIGSNQTISQPFVVALMTQEASIGKGSKVLEIGTGSGYQAAVLSELGARVFSIEIIPELAESASSLLGELGYEAVKVRAGDGYEGWEEEAPFDAILVTAAAPEAPKKLLEQLAHRGRMVIPIEDEDGDGETLVVIERDNEDLVVRDLGKVRFVPLTGKARE